MKKFFKIFGITLGSIVGVLLVAVVILCNVVFSPARLTPLVNKYADRFISCRYSLEQVDLTFFSSFPDFALRVSNVVLVNPVEGAQSDTLLRVDELSASIEIMDLIRYNALVVQHVELDDGVANIYRGGDTICNYDIFITDTTATEEESDSTPFLRYLGLNAVMANNVSATYVDRALGIDARIDSLSLMLHARFFAHEEGEMDVEGELGAGRIALDYGDSTRIEVRAAKPQISIEGLMEHFHFDGELRAALDHVDFRLGGETMVHDRSLRLRLPADANLRELYANIHKGASVAVDKNKITLSGKVDLCDNGDIYMGVDFATNEWDIERTLGLIPRRFASLLADYRVSGGLRLSGRLNGTLAEDNYPLIFADVRLRDCNADIKGLPVSLTKTGADLHADVNLNPGQTTDLVIRSLRADADRIHVEASGSVTDLLGAAACDLSVRGNLPLDELHKFLPRDVRLTLGGTADLDLAARFALADITKLNLKRIRAKGHIDYRDLDVLYNDSIHATDSRGRINIALPSPHRNKVFAELGELGIDGTHLDIDMTGTLRATAESPRLDVGFGDIMSRGRVPEAALRFDMGRLRGTMDTISFDLGQPRGSATLFPMKDNPGQPGITAAINLADLRARMGGALAVSTRALALSGFTTYEQSDRNILLRLNPRLSVELADGDVAVDGLAEHVVIPQIKFDYRPSKLDIARSRIRIGSSDFALDGRVTNINEFIEGSALLRGELNFTSERTNVDELMALVNGMGSTEAELEEGSASPAEAEADRAADPFIVPRGVDMALHTNIRHAIFEGRDIKDVRGGVTVKDGVLIADQLGFTADAGRMQLTAIYRSPRRNHLFLGLDFHLLQIDIHELISMIPSIDTIVPMLKSFEGRAEFHLAAETYLNARYEPKLSTMRGAAAIEGRDLVVLDNETFSTIAKYMMFNKRTRNVIDSLSVEATLFRREVDVYPFLLTMDKWQAVLAGRHNLDNSFNYHISLTDCPLPVRLGLDVYGTFDHPRFKLVPCQYKALYKPEKRGATEERTLALKKMISDALKANVRE